MNFHVRNFFPLQPLISPRNQDHFRWFFILWIRLEVIFQKIPFSPISSINFSSDLIKFEDYIKKLLNSLWIRPIFTTIPLNSSEFPKIGKFGIIFDAIPRKINDLAVSSRHMFITNLRLELSSIHFFWFHHLFTNIFSLKNPKNFCSTLDQGFSIFERSLEVFDRFISSPRTFSSFYRSFPLSKYIKHQKYLLISIS